MPECLVVQRITSKALVVTFNPLGIGEATHVQVLNIPADITAGTFQLRINGRTTTAIDTQALDLAAEITAAIEALPGFVAGDVVVDDTDPTAVTVTFAQDWVNKYVDFGLVSTNEQDELELTGGNMTTSATTQGSGVYTISTDISDFSETETQETTDVTGISEEHRIHATTVKDASFDYSVYHANQEWRSFIKAGMCGILSVYPQGIGSGLEWFQWNVLLTEASTSYTMFEKVEVQMSGRRQGKPIVDSGSIQS